MNKETFEQLLADKPPEIRGKGVILFNAAAETALAYQKAPTAANLRDMQASEAGLEKFQAQLAAGDSADMPLPTIADVLNYLKDEGWRVTKTSLYRHQKEGKIIPRPDGAYALKDVDKYARTWLKQQSTGKKISEKQDELQRRKLEIEIRNLELDQKRKERAYEKDCDRYIPREQMDVELATRAGILDAGLKHWVKTHAAEWIRLVGGDMNKIGEFINQMVRELDEHVNSYASATEFEVVIDAEDETISDEYEEKLTEGETI